MEPLGPLSESSPDIIDTSDQRLVNELENTPKADVSNSVERSDKKLTSATSPKGHISSLAPPVDDIPSHQFECQVQDLCRYLWSTPGFEATTPLTARVQSELTTAAGEPMVSPTSSEQNQFFTEPMRGGGYNRVMGITKIAETLEHEARMVLRVPRMGVPWSDEAIIILRFVQKYTNIPVPHILAYSSIDKNPLKEPYVLQTRIPGHDLESKTQSYLGLSHEQKLVFVEQFCRILLEMQRVRHPWAGQIVSRYESEHAFSIGPFQVSQEDDSLVNFRSEVNPFFKVRSFSADEVASSDEETDRSSRQTPLHFFEIQFARWKTLQMGLDPSEQWFPDIWQRLRIAATQMDRFGCLDCESYCLTHYDLDPRNIMVEIQAGVAKITGIIDWDSVMFAPNWVSCKPPIWIWNWLDGGNEDESKANEDPPTSQQKELKDLFDELVGSQFRFNAYQPHYRLARQMFRFARCGIGSFELMEQADKVLEEWDVLYAERQTRWAEWEREKTKRYEDIGSE